MGKVDLVIIGNLSIDTTYFYQNDEVVQTCNIGGAVLYSSLPASLFNKVGIVSKVGDNYDMSIFKKYSNIDLEGLQVIEGEKSTEFITHYYDQHNQKNREMEELINFNLEIKPSDIPENYLKAKYIHFATNYPYKQKELIEYVRNNSNAIISVDTIEQYSTDPILTSVFDMVDIAFIDDNFYNLLESKAETRIIKCGKNGCVLKQNNKDRKLKAIPIDDVVDKTGAGDCLNGVFLANLSKGIDIVKSLEKAVDVATYSINFYGLENIKDYLNK